MNYKFRVWSDYHKSFVIEGGGFGLQRLFEDFSFTLRGRFSRGEDYKMPNNVEDYKINQWTGLKDSTGKDIYEGDIIQFEMHLCLERVIFRDGAFGVHFNWKHSKDGRRKDSDSADFYPLLDIGYSKKVVGNFYQNPELLNT